MNAAGATISNSEALGKDVHATSATGVRVGGLVGVNDGDIRRARVREVKGGGSASAGGLVGRNTGNIFASESATLLTESGNNSHAGGLVGYNEGNVMAAVSTSRVAAGSYSNVGGLVGTNGLPAKVYHSESSGVLAGKTGCSANNTNCSWTSGQVTMGGLVGLNRGLVSGSSSSSSFHVYDAAKTGGLVGMNQGRMEYNTALGAAALLRPAGVNQGIIEP